METGEILYITTRNEWRKWLSANFDVKKEIWLIYYNVSSGKPTISYNDAVEEALCFGWIDSTVKSHDEQYSRVQRFTPRNPKSTYSQCNKERVKWLYHRNLIHLSIINSILFIIDEEFIFPIDIIEVLKKDPIVWSNYNKFTDAYKRIRISYINDARDRPDEFAKRLDNFIVKTKQNKQIIGYGGINKYY